ncbi:unnamed protein product [Paramecium primaurelia]|uniref:Uncharacterized protein n=1 Tax=Paramecium primaurelia TaxID=5886 RepID=A0A8S1Q990_PARPR|nr:unnamed protein product [Paramecium primaurelia]
MAETKIRIESSRNNSSVELQIIIIAKIFWQTYQLQNFQMKYTKQKEH